MHFCMSLYVSARNLYLCRFFLEYFCFSKENIHPKAPSGFLSHLFPFIIVPTTFSYFYMRNLRVPFINDMFEGLLRPLLS
jgi:hypothetical protein